MKFNHDYFNTLSPPQYILIKANGDRISPIECITKKYSFKFNLIDQIEFETYMYLNGKLNPIYNLITEGKFIEVEDLGKFVLSDIDIDSEGDKFEKKTCKALSMEILLGQKYLETFSINMGTTESIDGVVFYNLQNPNKSLLHLVLEKCPDWEIGHIDTSLMTVERCFEITRQDIYSFLTQDVSNAFQCIFQFDSLRGRINVYKEDNVGKDTDIFVSYNNLLNNTSISSSIDDIKTCLTVVGADDLSLREVNMGYDKIYMLDYYNSTEYMSQGLFDAYNTWKKKWNDNLSTYSSLLSQYQDFYKRINYLTNEKMPTVPGSTNWTEYGLVPLQEQKKIHEEKLSIMIKSGHGDTANPNYNTRYIPTYNLINSIKAQISVIESEISVLKSQQSVIGTKMNTIIDSLDMRRNFTKEQLNELTKFIREDELSSTNFVVTDTMTDSERIDMLNEMLEYGRKELRKKSQPQLQFQANLVNLFEIKEFSDCSIDFDVGNFINVILRDDYIIKARLLTIDMDFYNPENFSVTFGNLNKVNGKNKFTDITKAIDTATSVATTVSFNSSHWNKANKDATEINQMLADGLLAAGESLKTARSDITIDDRGIIVSNIPESKYPNDRIFIGNSQILFSDDDFKSIKTGLGRLTYTKKGVTYNDFGLLANFVIAGYIAGSTIEGNEVIAGTITGSHINNGNGTFAVTPDGRVTASVGNIAGWELSKNAIYNNIPFTNQKNSKSTGMGTYGGNWAFWAGNGKFSVDQDGRIVAESGVIGGCEIGANYIKATNGNWQINSDGSASFRNVYVNGVQAGSAFGGVTFNGSGTYGGFNNGLFAGSSFGLNGGALNNFNDLVANKVTAAYIDATVQLSAKYATIDTLNATTATINQLIANNLQSINILTQNLSATNAEIKHLKSESISVNRLKAGTVNGRRIDWQEISVPSGYGQASGNFIKADGTTGNAVTNFIVYTRRIYVMAHASDD